ncbi:cyclin-P [Tiliqua scincoides]|uniref:cyclin-P n=1 Tax=Tiliqua scincoides TaxID=71010 RepID=UPI0034618A6A
MVPRQAAGSDIASALAPAIVRELVEEKREPLKSKSNKGLNGDLKGTRKEKDQGSYKQEALPEKLGATCPKTPAVPSLQRAVPVSESLAEELSQAMLRLDMGLEQEYAYDIFSSLQKQPCYAFGKSDVPPPMTAEMRALVIDWVVQVHEYLGLAESTLYLATYLMSAYMRVGKVRVPRLQLLGIACLFLACKVEESTLPTPARLCFMMEDAFTQKDLLRMERKILSRLKFELHYTNPAHLLCLLAQVGHCTLELQNLAMYFMELTLLEVDCLCFEPAQLSLAALCLAQRVLREAGSSGLEASQEASPRLLTYSESELAAVHPFMARAALRGAGSTLRGTFLKYSRPQKLGVSTSPSLAASNYLHCCLGSPSP